MSVGDRQRCLETVPPSYILEADPYQGQKTSDDQKELQDLVVDGAGESAEEDVAEDDDRREENREVKDPAHRQIELEEERIEDVQCLDETRHGVHRNAGGKYRHHREGAGIVGAGLFIEAQPQELRNRPCLGAVVE